MAATFRYYDHNLNLDQHQIQFGVDHVLAAPPASPAPVLGQYYYDSVKKQRYQWDGTQWVTSSAKGVWQGEDTILSGLPTTGIQVGDIAGLQVDNVGTGTVALPQYPRGIYKWNGTQWDLALNLSTPSNITDPFIFMGGIDASTNPNYPAADSGHVYRITAAGKLGGAAGVDVQPNDTVYCFVDATAAGNQAAVGANWVVIGNTAAGTVATNLQAFTETDATLQIAPSSLHGFARKQAYAIGDGTAKSFTISHTMGTDNLDVTVFDNVLKTFRHPSIELPDNATVVISGFTVAPTLNALRVMLTENAQWV